jgi:hypothetical protein
MTSSSGFPPSFNREESPHHSFQVSPGKPKNIVTDHSIEEKNLALEKFKEIDDYSKKQQNLFTSKISRIKKENIEDKESTVSLVNEAKMSIQDLKGKEVFFNKNKLFQPASLKQTELIEKVTNIKINQYFSDFKTKQALLGKIKETKDKFEITDIVDYALFGSLPEAEKKEITKNPVIVYPEEGRVVSSKPLDKNKPVQFTPHRNASKKLKARCDKIDTSNLKFETIDKKDMEAFFVLEATERDRETRDKKRLAKEAADESIRESRTSDKAETKVETRKKPTAEETKSKTKESIAQSYTQLKIEEEHYRKERKRKEQEKVRDKNLQNIEEDEAAFRKKQENVKQADRSTEIINEPFKKQKKVKRI